MKKIDFIALMSAAIADQAKYICFIIEMPDMAVPEFIINTYENAEKKLEYMINAYDDNMNHKHAVGVKLKGLVVTNLLAEITYAILDQTVNKPTDTGNLLN